MPLSYPTGEAVEVGDQVIYDGETGHVELVVDEATCNAETDWYLKTLGAGILIREPKVFGRVYVTEDDFADGWLKFVSRSESA